VVCSGHRLDGTHREKHRRGDHPAQKISHGGCGDEEADDSGNDFTILQTTASAAPGTATGPAALALAAVIAQQSPAVRAFDRRVIARLFRGNIRFGFTPNTKISVDADSVVCRVSNVDITSRSCELKFGSRKRTLTGREANEVGATAAAAGIPSQGAAGSSIESVSNLRCTVDPNEIMQKAGGGAECSFETAQ
jgi:hypothetical protein